MSKFAKMVKEYKYLYYNVIWVSECIFSTKDFTFQNIATIQTHIDKRLHANLLSKTNLFKLSIFDEADLFKLSSFKLCVKQTEE